MSHMHEVILPVLFICFIYIYFVVTYL